MPMGISRETVKSIYIDVCFYNGIENISLATATGFLIKKDQEVFLITSRHVVTGRNNETDVCLDKNGGIPSNLQVKIPFYFKDGLQFFLKEINLYNGEEKLWFEHPIYKNEVDVIALSLGNLNTDLTYDLDSKYETMVSDDVFIIGYPYGYSVVKNDGKFAIWSRGTVASELDLNLIIANNEVPAFLIDSRTRAGQSGSPVIFHSAIHSGNGGVSIVDKKVTFAVGIYSGRMNKDSDLGYVWKWSLINEIIQSIK